MILFLLFLSFCIPVRVSAGKKPKLNKTKCIITKGDKLNLKLINGGKQTKFSSRDSKTATVVSRKNNTAVIKGKKKGKTTILAKYRKKSYSCIVTVEEPKINVSKKTLNIGNKVTLSLSSAEKPVWKTSDSKTASVTPKGKTVIVTARNPGQATITAKLRGHIYKSKITVNPLSLNITGKTITKNDSFTLILNHAEKTDFTGANKAVSVTKKSKNTALIQGKAKGTTTITAKYANRTYRCKVVVEAPVLSAQKKEIVAGNQCTLTLNGTTGVPSWTVSNKNVASLKANGKQAVITGKNPGTATITAGLRNHIYKAVVTVKKKVTEAKPATQKENTQVKETATSEAKPATGEKYPSDLEHYFKVVDGKVMDVITGKEVTGCQVEGEYFKGDNSTLIPVTAETDQTIEAVVDYDEDRFTVKNGVFDAFDNTNGNNHPISTFGLSYSNKSYAVKVNRMAENPYQSNNAGINTSYLRKDGYYVYQNVPEGDNFIGASGDNGNKHAIITVNGAVNEYDMDKSLPWYYRDCIRKIRFTDNHKIKYVKFYKGAKTKDELLNDFLESGIVPEETEYAADGIAGLGSPDAYMLDNNHIKWTEFEEKPGIYESNGKNIGLADYDPDYQETDNGKYESIHIINKRETMMKGKQYPFTAYPYPVSVSEDGTDDYQVLWKSSDPEVASVYEGLVIAKKEGTATITATLAGTEISDSFELTVTAPPEAHENVFHVPEDYTSSKGDTFSDTGYTMTMRAIFAAIDEAKANGCNKVVFPQRKFYASVFPSARFMYYVPSEMTIEFPEGSELHMMYEETQSQNNEFHVFEFGVPGNDYENRCVNSHMIIHDYFGERYEDSLDGEIEEDKYIEEIRFAEFGRKAENCSIEIINANYTAGYFITVDGTSSDPNKTDGVITHDNLIQGRYNTDGSLQEDENWISTEDYVPVPQQIKKDGYFLSAHGQNSHAGKYWNGCTARLYDILWFDENKNLIESRQWQGITEYYDIPENAAYFKVSLQQKSLPATEDTASPWLAMHDNGCARDCEIKNIYLNNSATGLFSVTGETDGLYIHDNYVPADGKKRYDERTGDFENGWQAMRHSVFTHNVFSSGHFASGGHNTFMHTNCLGEEVYTRPDDEFGRIINNKGRAFICAEKIHMQFFYNQTRTVLWNQVKGWECAGKLHKKYIKGI